LGDQPVNVERPLLAGAMQCHFEIAVAPLRCPHYPASTRSTALLGAPDSSEAANFIATLVPNGRQPFLARKINHRRPPPCSLGFFTSEYGLSIAVIPGELG
jgi:hypothetical protein